MDPNTAVATSPLVALLAFLGVIVLLLFLIAKWRWHVFLALLVPLLLFGIVPGVQQNNFINAFETGFGSTLGSIGVVTCLARLSQRRYVTLVLYKRLLALWCRPLVLNECRWRLR